MPSTHTRVESVVLLDAAGRAIGTAPKSGVHGSDTALHLAFSCYVLNERGEVLVTRRALDKSTWPGVWTNSFCGHPLPAERMRVAIARRAEFELGLELSAVRVVLPGFRYRATDSSGTVENEICPVFVARTAQEPVANPGEVAGFRWSDPVALRRAVLASPRAFSPWMAMQLRELVTFDA